MPIHYEIETDGLYLEGFEKGFKIGFDQGYKIGIEIGIERSNFNNVLRMLLQKKYTINDIMVALDVTEAFIKKVALEIGIEIEPIS
jgi:hypothetical protein